MCEGFVVERLGQALLFTTEPAASPSRVQYKCTTAQMIISILGEAEKIVACALPSREAAPRAYDLRGDARADSSMDRRFNEAVQNAVNTKK